MKRKLTVTMGLAMLVASTGAAAAVSTYKTTLLSPGLNGVGKKPCGTVVGGTGTFSYDDSTKLLQGSYTLTTPAPVTTTIVLGAPDIFLPYPNCSGSTCTIARNLTAPDASAADYEATLADGGFYLSVEQQGQPIFRGQLVPDDGKAPIFCADEDSGAGDAGPSTDAAIDSAGEPPVATISPPVDPPAENVASLQATQGAGCAVACPHPGASSGALVLVLGLLAIGRRANRRRRSQ